MGQKLPSIIVTGASGIVGRNFLEAARKEFLVYAIARRSREEAGVPDHPNIIWLQVDISNSQSLQTMVFQALKINKASAAENRSNSHLIDFVLHLASYYDLNYTPHPEYRRTNVEGTRNILELSRILKIKRFIFASSIAASQFPAPGGVLNEKSPVDGSHPYAISKREGEELVKSFSKDFPCSIARLAAVYTDWGEYGILYMLLLRWFSRWWGARILGGKGDTSIPFIHTHDLNLFFMIVLQKTQELPKFDIYIASPDKSTSHLQLFQVALKYHNGRNVKPVSCPKFVASFGVRLLALWRKLLKNPPLERSWMAKYLDMRMDIDASYSRAVLGWQPAPRFHILRRLPFLVEKMRNYPDVWHYRNALAMKRVAVRPNLLVYDIMIKLKDEVVEKITAVLTDQNRKIEYRNYQGLDPAVLAWDVGVFYQLLTASVRNKDRFLLVNYTRDFLVLIRSQQGFSAGELCNAVVDTSRVVISTLLKQPELKGMERLIHDDILLTIQLTVDEIENAFEELSQTLELPMVPARSDIEKKLEELEARFLIPQTGIPA